MRGSIAMIRPIRTRWPLILAAAALGILTSYLVGVLFLSFPPDRTGWDHTIAGSDPNVVIVSRACGLTVATHEASFYEVIDLGDHGMIRRGFGRSKNHTAKTSFGSVVHGARMDRRSRPNWARRTLGHAFSNECVAGWPLRCFRAAWWCPDVGLFDDPPLGSARFRGAIAIGDPALAYGGSSRGLLLPLAVRPAEFGVNATASGAAWLVVLAGYAASSRWFRGLIRRRRGRCPACGYDLAGAPPGPCPECGRAATAT